MKHSFSSIKLFFLLLVITLSCTAFQCNNRFGVCNTFVPKDMKVKFLVFNPQLNSGIGGNNFSTVINKTAIRLQYEAEPVDTITNPAANQNGACTALVVKDKLQAVRIYNEVTIGPLAAETEICNYFKIRNNQYDIDNKYYLNINESLPFINNQAMAGNLIFELVKPITISASQNVQFRIELDFLRDNLPITFANHTQIFKVTP